MPAQSARPHTDSLLPPIGRTLARHRFLVWVLLVTSSLAIAERASAQSYMPYSEIGPHLLSVQSAHPGISALRYDLGLSGQGRHLWAIRISDNVGVEEDEPEFKYASSMHGDEIVGFEMCLRLIDELTLNYETDPRIAGIVNEIDIWIVPLMNPDGYDRSPRMRNNASGINLNRDFPDPFTSPTNSPTGRAAETGVIMSWSFGQSFTASANFHGGALLVNYPYDNNPSGASVYTASPDDDLFIVMSETYSQHNLPMWNSPSFFHGITNGADWYAISGGMQDWNYRYMGCNAVTIELSDNKEPPYSQIPTFWQQNRESMLSYMETCLMGVRGVVTGYGSGEPMAATVTVAGRESQVYSDPDVGDFHRMLLPGTYDLTISAERFDPVTLTDVIVGDGPATRRDVQLAGAPEIAYPNGGEQLVAGTPVSIAWTGGSPAAQFQVQYTPRADNIEQVSEAFEGVSLDQSFDTGGDADWHVTTGASHRGFQSARAGDIGDEHQSWMTCMANEGTLSFWYSVSSEANYDFFNFYVNGEREVHASGTTGWLQFYTTLPPGTHELRWEYAKDVNTTSGSDTVWIDDMTLNRDNTEWLEVIPLTPSGAQSTGWTPTGTGSDYRVRVRAALGSETYGSWDASDASFEVTASSVSGDFDGDGDVDLGDWAAFQQCCPGLAVGPCGDAFDFSVDGVIDAADFEGFAARFTGP